MQPQGFHPGEHRPAAPYTSGMTDASQRTKTVWLFRGIGIFFCISGIISLLTRGEFGIESLWFGVFGFRQATHLANERLIVRNLQPSAARKRQLLLMCTQVVPLYFLAYATRVIVYLYFQHVLVARYAVAAGIAVVLSLAAVQLGPKYGRAGRHREELDGGAAG